MAMLQYSQDSDEFWPCSLDAGAGNVSKWCSCTFPYTKSAGVYVCPDDPNKNKPVSYAENGLLGKLDWGGGPLNSLASDSAPALTVMFCEITNYSHDVTPANETGSPRQCLTDRNSDGTSVTGTAPGGNKRVNSSPRHTDGSQYVALDGHVKYVRPERVSTGSSPAEHVTDRQDADPNGNCLYYFESCAAGTGAMDTGSGSALGSAVLTFSPN